MPTNRQVWQDVLVGRFKQLHNTHEVRSEPALPIKELGDDLYRLYCSDCDTSIYSYHDPAGDLKPYSG